MSLRVAVHAEGSRETGAFGLRPRPGDPLGPERLGPAHVLVRRCLVEGSELPEGAVRFVEPLRTATSRVARGSDFLNRPTLRRLLTWLDPAIRPDLAVIIVDADGDAGRRARLAECVADLPLPRVVSVAVQEFEAWLIADSAAVSGALGRPFETPPAPETLRPRAAKALLGKAVAEAGASDAEARLSIAHLATLDGIAKRCPAFAALRADLGAASRGRP